MPAWAMAAWMAVAGCSVLVPAEKLIVTLAPPTSAISALALARSNSYG